MKMFCLSAPSAYRILALAELFFFSNAIAAALFPRHAKPLSALSASRPGHLGLDHLGDEVQPRLIEGKMHETDSLLGHAREDDVLDAIFPSSSMLLSDVTPGTCYQTYDRVTSSSQHHFTCPSSCPIMAKDKTNRENHCRFQCIDASASQCKALNPGEPIPDEDMGFCRACMINGCDLCTRDGKDTCEVCMAGFALDRHGHCYNKLWWAWYVIGALVGIIFVPLIIWAMDLSCRKTTNEKGLERGLNARSRAKFHQPADPYDPFAPRMLWPWYTNLCREEVGGNGLILHFNFQAVLIVWAFVLTIVWAGFIFYVSEDLGILGTRRADTPWENCWVVQWGLETQVKLMWTKVAFATFVYIFSFVGIILFGIRQLRITQLMDEAQSTHMDYCAHLEGIPELDGTVLVEEELMKFLEEKTEVSLVGVSVCWDMGDQADVCKSVLECQLDERDIEADTGEDDEASMEEGSMSKRSNVPSGLRSHQSDAHLQQEGGQIPGQWLLRKILDHIEQIALGPGTQWFIAKSSNVGNLKDMKEGTTRNAANARRSSFNNKTRASAEDEEADTEKVAQEEEGAAEGEIDPEDTAVVVEEVDTESMIRKFTTSGQAFVVFQSEVERDKALKVCKEQTLMYRGSVIKLHEKHCEPESILWENYERVETKDRAIRAAQGFGIIFGALFVWTAGFYLPYAYYAMSFNYAHGQEPGAIESLTFSMVVVAGNAIMYLVCSEVAERQRFGILGDRETCYLLLYTFACVFNVVLDLYIAYRVAYRMMVGVGMKTYYGTPLADVDSFAQRFETYAMQRELGNTLMDYAFPSTFLIPFLIEPIVTILLPYQLMVLFVRTHAELPGLDCERCLAAAPLDLSRYADLLLNVILAVMILYFPGGFNIKMFFTLALSHMFIYAFDHWRVLYSVPACKFSKMTADWWAQWMTSIPIGLVLSCIVFKAHTEDIDHSGDENYGDRDYTHERDNVMFKSVLAFFAHVIVHTLVLCYVVPLFGKASKEPSKQVYELCAKSLPCSWFSANPVFCLRSEYIYKHEPPSDYYIHGKEHLIRENKEIGVYFHEVCKSQEEDTYGNLIKKSVSGWMGSRSPSATTESTKP